MEARTRKGEIHTSLVLQLIQPLSSLCDFCDVLPHDANGVVNLLLDSCRLRVSRASRVRGGAATGQVGVIGLRPRMTAMADACTWLRGTRERMGRGGKPVQSVLQEAIERMPLTWLFRPNMQAREHEE